MSVSRAVPLIKKVSFLFVPGTGPPAESSTMSVFQAVPSHLLKPKLSLCQLPVKASLSPPSRIVVFIKPEEPSPYSAPTPPVTMLSYPTELELTFTPKPVPASGSCAEIPSTKYCVSYTRAPLI